MVSVLAITSSPRRHGNSESALDFILERLPQNYAVEKIILNGIKVNVCKGCGFCEKTGDCIQKDDFIPLIEKIENCDVLIFASPVYSMSVCAQGKALIDRCQVFWSRKYLLKTFSKGRGKAGLFISTAGQTRDNIFDHTVPVARFLFDVSGISNKNTVLLLLKGLDDRNDFKKSEEAKSLAKISADELIQKIEAL
ncbi:MAG: flavodoxin family protein [Methanocorpusculum sp.]|nr:flavodoxin family protein [Methanocorpusculum sp.]